MAKERGIRVVEVKDTSIENYSNLLTISVTSNKEKRSISGMVIDNKNIRIVNIDGYRVEAVPEGDMLIFSNLDKPGLIGKIGTILGEENINIAAMQFGREKPGGRAITVINLDSPVNDKIIEKLKNIKNVESVKYVKV